jgi:hypothetical protein
MTAHLCVCYCAILVPGKREAPRWYAGRRRPTQRRLRRSNEAGDSNFELLKKHTTLDNLIHSSALCCVCCCPPIFMVDCYWEQAKKHANTTARWHLKRTLSSVLSWFCDESRQNKWWKRQLSKFETPKEYLKDRHTASEHGIVRTHVSISESDHARPPCMPPVTPRPTQTPKKHMLYHGPDHENDRCRLFWLWIVTCPTCQKECKDSKLLQYMLDFVKPFSYL